MRQRMSIKSRRELLGVTYERYQKSSAPQKKRILDEFVVATGYQRKHAIELLLHPPRLRPQVIKRSRKRRYNLAVKRELINLWKIANCICGKRLIPFLPELIEVLERHKEPCLEPYVKKQLLKMSAATADRLLSSERKSFGVHGKCTTKPGTLLRRQIPVRTFADWNENKPGFMEVDLVAHCNDDAGGEFLYSLVMTDVLTGWTECIALLKKGQHSVFAGIKEARRVLPFPLVGLDSDNGSEFINGLLLRYCQEEKITLTRCRPYRKNDQCHVEEKNWSIVRKMVGYDRYEGEKACSALQELYQTLRLYENFFQPCMKLIGKERVNTTADLSAAGSSGSSITGTKVCKKYEAAKTPYQRVLGSGDVSEKDKERLRAQYQELNPRQLLLKVHELQKRLWAQAKIYRAVKEG